LHQRRISYFSRRLFVRSLQRTRLAIWTKDFLLLDTELQFPVIRMYLWIDVRDEDRSLVGGISVPAMVWRDMELLGRYSVIVISRSSLRFDIEDDLSPPPDDDSDLSTVFVQQKGDPLDPGIANDFDARRI
jgi:hypothetical protein